MALAPIRGAPPGAPNPDFPIDAPKATPARSTRPAVADDQSRVPPVRVRHTPIELSDGGIALIFRVIPEQPAIARASLCVDMVAGAVDSSPSNRLGFLRMSASSARAFLTNLRDGHSRLVATGDEDGTIELEYETSGARPTLIASKPGEPEAMHRWIIDERFDLQTMATELLADLGA